MFMKYDRYFLENVHNDIKAYMAAMDLEPHRRPQNLISHLHTPLLAFSRYSLADRSLV